MHRFERKRRGLRAWSGLALPWLFGAALQCAGLAHAQTPAGDAPAAPGQLTSRGRLLGSGMLGGSWSAVGGLLTERQSWRVHASPALIYFLRDRLGLGLTFGGSFGQSPGSRPGETRRQSDLFIGALAAFDLPISDQLSFLIQPAFNYVNLWNESSISLPEQPPNVITFPSSLHLQIVRPALSLQLVVRVSPHVGFAFGPDFWADIIVDDGGLRRIQAMLTERKQKYARAQLGLSAGLLLSF